MNLNVKAALLSAFVVPGLGQIVNGKKLKGFLLITLVNIFILVALAIILKGIGPFLLTMKAGSAANVFSIAEQVQQNSGSGPRWLLMGFLVIWAYSCIDALVDRPAPDDDEQNHESD